MVVCSLEGTYAQGSMDDGVLHMLNQNRHHWPPHVTQRCGVLNGSLATNGLMSSPVIGMDHGCVYG